jgi:hypothetical protein
VSDTPLVSFLIAAFNEERFVVACVASCLHQTYTPVEVCVTDDGSTDGTWDILQAAFGQDPRVRLDRFEQNRGKVYAFNRCYEMAKGNYIAIMGADDICKPERIERTIAPLLADRETVLSFCDLAVVDESLHTIHASIYHMLGRREELGEPGFDYASCLATSPLVCGGGMTIGPGVKDHIFPIPETLLVEDWWISFVAAFFGRFHFVDEPLVQYRQHGGNDNGAIHGILDDYRTRVRLAARHPAIFAAFLAFLDGQGSSEHVHLIEVEKHINELVQFDRATERHALTRAFMDSPRTETLSAKEHARIRRYTRFGRRWMLLSVIRKHLSLYRSPRMSGPSRD